MRNDKVEIVKLLLNVFKSDSSIYIYGWEKVTQDLMHKLRHTCDYSCEEIAKELGISLRLVYHYQTGTRPISVKNLCKLTELSSSIISDFDLPSDSHLLVSSGSGSRKRIARLPLTMSSDLFYVAGYLFGDGCLYLKKWTISFVDEYEEHLLNMKRIIESIFSVRSRIVRGDRKWELIIYSKSIILFFNALFGMPFGVKKNKLHIPGVLFSQTSDSKLSFISGLFDADAGILRVEEYAQIPDWFLSSPCIEFVQADRNFVCEIKEFCLNMGLPITGPYFNPANNGYRLFLSGRTALQKCNLLPLFRHPMKTLRLAAICDFFKLQARIALATSASM